MKYESERLRKKPTSKKRLTKKQAKEIGLQGGEYGTQILEDGIWTEFVSERTLANARDTVVDERRQIANREATNVPLPYNDVRIVRMWYEVID